MKNFSMLLVLSLGLTGCKTFQLSDHPVMSTILTGSTTAKPFVPRYGPDIPLEEEWKILKADFEKKLHQGMMPYEVSEFITLRYHVNTSTGSWGTHEQWAYGFLEAGNAYLYFEDGKLTSWQIDKR